MTSQTECEVCGSTSYQIIGGSFFCSDCQSQSQHFEVAHEQEFAETHGTDASLILRASLAHKKKTGAKDAIEKGVAEDREISAQCLCEAYTVMLCKISNAIITSLKLDPRSKESILRLWIRFLQHKDIVNIANDTSEGQKHFSAVFGKSKKSCNYRQPQSSTLAEFLRETESLNRSNIERSKKTATGDLIAENDGELNAQGESSIAAREKEITLLETILIIVYLGLVEDHVKILVSDIGRWINQDFIQLHWSISEFPAEYQSDSIIHHIHRAATGLNRHWDYLENFQSKIKRVAKILNVANVYSMGPVETIARLVLDLNLPLDVMKKLKTIMNLKENLFQHLQKHPVERVASALLIVCLKLLFGFDDHAEHLIHDVVVKQQLLLDSQLNRQKPFKIMHWIKQQRLRETVVYEGVPLARALSKSYLDAKLTVSNRLMLRWLEKKDIKRPFMNSELSEVFDIGLESERVWRKITIFPLKSTEHFEFPIRVSETVDFDNENQKLFSRNHSRDILLFPDVLAERLQQIRETTKTVDASNEIPVFDKNFPCAHRYIMYWNSPGKEIDTMGVGVPVNFEALRLEFSISFDWLLHFMARRIEDSPETLFSVISDIEEYIFEFKMTRLFRQAVLNKPR